MNLDNPVDKWSIAAHHNTGGMVAVPVTESSTQNMTHMALPSSADRQDNRSDMGQHTSYVPGQNLIDSWQGTAKTA